MDSHASERSSAGSALVLALLVVFLLSMLGISFLLMAETENRIAENEKRSALVLYAAESGARAVKSWFDHPAAAPGFPAPGDVNRNLRRVLDESDPADPNDMQPADGSSIPYYKQSSDELFARPYRGSLEHSLMGSEEYPDLSIDDADDQTNAAPFLQNLSTLLLDDVASRPEALPHVRISRIDVYAPPYLDFGAAGWRRYGMATIRVTARLYQGSGPQRRVLAERTVRAVLNEIPYSRAYGPLHSCSDLSATTEIGIHWGTATAAGAATLPGALSPSLPREVPPVPRIERLWPTDPVAFQTFKDGLTPDQAMADPWARLFAGESISGAPNVATQPYLVARPADGACCDQSNVFQNVPVVGCPPYDYDLWKAIASSGERGAHYYVWTGVGDTFRENGQGPARSFAEITNGQSGLCFFDTAGGLQPDTDGDGVLENLTAPITVGGSWSFQGFIYLNTESVDLSPITGGSVITFRMPGEPFQDLDGDGMHEPADGEGWIDLSPYPADLDSPFTIETGGGAPERLEQGPVFTAEAALWGILYTNGSLRASDAQAYYGSVIARQGVSVDGGAPQSRGFYWDSTIPTTWPPADWPTPRVFVTRWRTEP